MRALFSTQPGFGHLNPFLPYAVALRDAGHEIRFASAPAFAEAIERHGFQCEPIGVNFTWKKVSEVFPEINDAARAGRQGEFAIFEITWARWNPKAARDLLALFERWRPDVLVREFAENGSTFAGESAGVPVVCAAWAALPFDADSWRDTVDWDRLVSCYAAVRRELGLAADEPGGAWRRQLTLTPLPPSWLRGDDRAAGVQHIRHGHLIVTCDGLGGCRTDRLCAARDDQKLMHGWGTWRVKDKLFVWERLLSEKDRRDLGAAAPDGSILGARVEDLGAKESYLQCGIVKYTAGSRRPLNGRCSIMF